jgi:hypothetical protein
MIAEHELVVLTVPLASEKLQVGDVGTVVHIHRNGEAFEVEFPTMRGGLPVALVTLEAASVRPLGDRDLFHVRELAA